MGLFSMSDLADSTKYAVIQCGGSGGGSGGGGSIGGVGGQKTFFEVAMNGNLVPSDNPPLRDGVFKLGENGNIIVTG